MSALPFWFPGTRSLASELKATYRPSDDTDGLPPLPEGLPPAVSTLTRVVDPAFMSRTKMSVLLLVSPATRSPAADANATYRPSALIDGWGPAKLSSGSPPARSTVTRVVWPVRMSRTNTFRLEPMPGTRSFAWEVKATQRPSALRSGS